MGKTRACRDPNARGTIWCFTEEGTKEWDYCDQQLTQDTVLTIEVNDVNDAPTAKLPKSDLNVYEDANNGDKVGRPIIGEDEDADDEVQYEWSDEIEGGGSVFDISSSTGQITVKNATLLNHEGVEKYNPVVLVTDKKGLTAKITTPITVLDVNEAPEVEDKSTSISEDVSSDLSLITIAISDPDRGDSHTCRIISGNIDNAFSLDSSSHSLTLGNASAVNYESGVTAYSLRVKCTDVKGEEDTATIVISVEDANEAPSILSQVIDLTENSVANVVVVDHKDIGITDEDNGGEVSNHTLQITAGDPANIFRVVGQNILINAREWINNVSTTGKPVIITSRSKQGIHHAARCPSDHVISFGFASQLSAGKGLNYASLIRVQGGKHSKQAQDNIGTPLNQLKVFEFGAHSQERDISIANARFSTEGAFSSVSTEPPTSWLREGNTVVVKSGKNEWDDLSNEVGFLSTCIETGDSNGELLRHSGSGLPMDVSISGCASACREDKNCRWWVFDENYKGSSYCWNKGDGTLVDHSSRQIGARSCRPKSSEQFVGLRGRGSSLNQVLKNLPANTPVTLSMRTSKAQSAGTTYLQVHQAGYGRIFPQTGGVRNADFGEGSTHKGFSYRTVPFWSLSGELSNGRRGTVVIESCNMVWGGLCSPFGSKYFVALHRSGSAISQKIKDLPKKLITLTLNVASRPGYGSEELLEILINGVVVKPAFTPEEAFSKIS